MNKSLYIVSLGCPKNLVDAEVMLGRLGLAGYTVCDTPEEASLLLVNTCGFIQPAVEEGIEAIMELIQIKGEDPAKVLVVTGCMVQRYGDDLVAELPEVDLFVGTEGFIDIDGKISRLLEQRQTSLEIVTPTYIMNHETPRMVSTPAHWAYLKITEGCNNRCSYCLIPSIRGKQRSRTVEDLVAEAQQLEQGGVRELTLIAQDLSAYGTDLAPERPTLAQLLTALAGNTSIPWFRMLYLHPMRITDQLLAVIAAEPRILPYLDIPLQHVSDRILRLMNRPYGRQQLEDLLAKIRSVLPGVALRTTFLVGFPGETEADMDELADFVQRHRFDHLGVFPYSNEEGSRAAELPDHLPEEVKEERRDRIMALQAAISLEKNQQRLGRTVEVLVDGVSGETELLLEGRAWFQAPDIDGRVFITGGSCDPGDIVRVELAEAHQYDLAGEIVA